MRTAHPQPTATAIIAARMGSSRLPGKTMAPILGSPMIQWMIERVKKAPSVRKIVVATTNLPEDDVLVRFLQRAGVDYFRGSPDDVLGRITSAAISFEADLILHLLGDNPLMHTEIMEDVLALYHAGDCDYSANVTTEHLEAGPELARFPVGIRAEAFHISTLTRCNTLAKDPYFREHSTSLIYQFPRLFRLRFLQAIGRWEPLNRPELTFAVNYPGNLELVRRIFEICYPVDPNFSLLQVLRVIEERPELMRLMGAPSP